ncbi:hypothetical protein CANCADRAFT_32059, partial [Tortispora caseinolytica NRRL Y-17796]
MRINHAILLRKVSLRHYSNINRSVASGPTTKSASLKGNVTIMPSFRRRPLTLPFDPVTTRSWADIDIPLDVEQTLVNNGYARPSAVQRSMFALLRSGLSMLVRSPPGAGKSFAALLYSLLTKRSLDNSVGHLILVPNLDLGLQYANWASQILKDSPYETTVLYQWLARQNEQEDARQIQRLQENPHPLLLIATPTRLLDIIESHPDLAR